MKGPLADYYHWEETGRGIRIYMHSAMVDRLQAEVLRAAACGPDSGTEAGGILLGRTEEDHGKTIAIVDDFVPVLCSHGGGRLYDVSGDDSVNLEAALLRAALAGCADADAPAILGYYRSHLREGMSLSAADLQVIDSYFQAPASVFLLIKTVAGGNACTAGFSSGKMARSSPNSVRWRLLWAVPPIKPFPPAQRKHSTRRQANYLRN